MKRIFAVLLIVWASSYSYFRATNSEVSAKDKRSYVMFPASPVGQALYYAWRPLSYADNALTGRGTHIGPMK